MTVTEHSTVGELLRARRLELGISLQDVAARTRVRRTYLSALENDRFDLIPGEVYVVGFLRIYADDLGLPFASLLVRCREQVTAEDAGREKMVSPPDPRPRGSRRRSGWAVSLTAAVLVGAALVLAHFSMGETRKANFFAVRSAPTGPPAVLWAVLMPEIRAEYPLPLSMPPPASLSPRTGEAALFPPLLPAPHRPAVRPRQAASRPVGVFLGWSTEGPGAPPVIGAGPQLLVLNRAGSPAGEGGGDDH